MRLGVIGINEKIAELKLREKLAKVCQQHFSADICAADAIPVVLLSTCNRTEVYFSAEDLAATHTALLDLLRQDLQIDFDQKLYSFFGKDCFQHLARVAAGLDSAILAETEIQGQVRMAYQMASSRRHLPHELHYAFQKALKIGKQVRKELPLGRGMPDLEHAILAAGNQALEKAQEARILFVGASDINHKVLCFMKRKGMHDVTLCNRSLHKAKDLAEKHGAAVLPWDQVSQWRQYDWVIFGTKAPDYLVSLNDVQGQLLRTRLLIDLSVPRNVDPAIARCPDLFLLNIDQLHNTLQIRRDSLSDLLCHAEELVAEAAMRLTGAFHDRERRRLGLITIGA